MLNYKDVTLAQFKRLTILWKRADQQMSFKDFVATASHYFGDYIGVSWCGMFVGIETDGYSHT